ncbi:biotin--[acetyl-CoA-carboxylase] ligase [Nocardiopsis lambiniae]|uniref:biotin--[biotin carboxyl-carrier protein] ligase n=1 Tax=Nocardiopsis lambiniae TaxID=3075539 RepID=A0ABU2M902_9ACTN|nr:biotin--[acetyl-CoA-carboxylase] ligase [Nocardiopsis sp. DSM 44743]MDT0329144.1 biotin--[acetyl-CoA-carboxylase] ligase [Nocardiopsis sp. DSM 44743]
MTSAPESFPRPPLDAAALNAVLARPDGMWERIEVVPEAGSTNTELAARARDGAPHGSVLVAEHQSAGRGRLGRGFSTPPRAALTVSLLLRPTVPVGRLGWLSALMGVAAVGAVRGTTGVEAALKWPNDLMVPKASTTRPERADGKLAGILAEIDFSSGAPAVVVGIGINVSQSREELPVATAVSLRGEGATDLDRGVLLASLLGEFEELYTMWAAAEGDAEAAGLAAVYRDTCVTVGHRVRVHLPDGRVLKGTATGIDADGRLVVDGPEGERALSAGDVVHVRPDR